MHPRPQRSHRTKIVCTIGPATADKPQLERLFDAGMDVARLNFSHGSEGWHRERVRLLREIGRERGCPIGILLDVPGPKLRVGEIPGGTVELHAGAEFRLCTEPVPGDRTRVSVSHASLPQELRPGDRIFLADGVIELEVIGTEPGSVDTRVVSGGPLSSHKGMNFPTRTLSVPSISEADRRAIRIGVEAAVDFIALSFVRSAEDVRLARRTMHEVGGALPLVAKIEKHEATERLDEILAEVEGLAGGGVGTWPWRSLSSRCRRCRKGSSGLPTKPASP